MSGKAMDNKVLGQIGAVTNCYQFPPTHPAPSGGKENLRMVPRGSRNAPADSSLTARVRAKAYLLPPSNHVRLPVVHVPLAGRLHADQEERQETAPLTGFYLPFPPTTMLWSYWTNSGYLDASSDIAEARQMLIEKMRTDPDAFIGKLTPCEPSCKTLAGVFKKAITG